MLDASGKLVGITTAKINGGEGLNFAIDVKLAQRLLEAQIAAMSIRLTVEPEDRRRLGNPFVKWLATSYAKDGRSTMAQFEEYSHNYNVRKITIEQAKALMFEIASRFVADAPLESSPQAPQTPRSVTLTCQLGNGTSQHYVIDFTASTGGVLRSPRRPSRFRTQTPLTHSPTASSIVSTERFHSVQDGRLAAAHARC